MKRFTLYYTEYTSWGEKCSQKKIFYGVTIKQEAVRRCKTFLEFIRKRADKEGLNSIYHVNRLVKEEFVTIVNTLEVIEIPFSHR